MFKFYNTFNKNFQTQVYWHYYSEKIFLVFFLAIS